MTKREIFNSIGTGISILPHRRHCRFFQSPQSFLVADGREHAVTTMVGEMGNGIVLNIMCSDQYAGFSKLKSI